MNYSRTHDLPEAVLTQMAALNAALRAPEPDPGVIARFLEALDALSPARVGAVYTALSNRVDMTRRVAPPKTALDWIFGPRPARADAAYDRTTTLAQMDRTPGLDTLFLFHVDGRVREAALKRVRTAGG